MLRQFHGLVAKAFSVAFAKLHNVFPVARRLHAFLLHTHHVLASSSSRNPHSYSKILKNIYFLVLPASVDQGGPSTFATYFFKADPMIYVFFTTCNRNKLSMQNSLSSCEKHASVTFQTERYIWRDPYCLYKCIAGIRCEFRKRNRFSQRRSTTRSTAVGTTKVYKIWHFPESFATVGVWERLGQTFRYGYKDSHKRNIYVTSNTWVV